MYEGGRGNFSRTFNIFFFIHCTGVCLYRILIAQKKKQFPVFAVKITFLMKKFLRQNKFRVVFSVASEHYFLMVYHSINNPESRQQSDLTSQNQDLLPGQNISVPLLGVTCIRGIFSLGQLFSIHVVTTPQGSERLWPARPGPFHCPPRHRRSLWCRRWNTELVLVSPSHS